MAQSEAGVPVLGLIDSVARQVQQQRIGVLATEATAASGAYGRALQAQRQGLTVVEMGCPAFVPAVEAHQLDTPQLRQAALRYLEPLLEARVEAIVLGCSHYPLLQPMLRELLPADVELIDPAHALVDLTLSLFPDRRSPLLPQISVPAGLWPQVIPWNLQLDRPVGWANVPRLSGFLSSQRVTATRIGAPRRSHGDGCPAFTARRV